jgi:transposase, IS30 family
MSQQFTKENRLELAALLRAGLSPLLCGIQLNRDKSAITREVSRNKDADGIYRGASAHKRYLARRKESKKKQRIVENNNPLQKHIRIRLEKRDSPEQISGRIEETKSHIRVSHETIYQWIFTHAPELKIHLRRIGKKGKYRRKRGTLKREKHRDEAKIRRIDTRPAVVETRERIGDWEGDTIIGGERVVRLATNVERKSGYGLIDKLPVVTAENMQRVLTKRFLRIPKDKRHTYTYDNGKELGESDRDLEKKIGMDVYRAYPYHSWERGSNENYNGLVRDFLPKGVLFATLELKEVKRVEKNLNHRPRKRLGYLTPYEVFVLGKKSGAVQT